MKFPWKWLPFGKKRRRASDVDPTVADDPEALQQQQLRSEFRRQLEIDQEMTRHRGMHGGGP